MNKYPTKKRMAMSVVFWVAMFILFSSMMGVAVWAAMNRTLNLSGNISFTATDVYATVSAGTVNGGTLTDSANKLQAVTLSANASEDTTEAKFPTWTNLVLTFPADGSDVTITFTITNLSTVRDMKVTLGKTTETLTNATMKVTFDGVAASTSSPKTVTKNNGTTEVVVTFSVTNKNIDASITNFNIPLTFAKA